MKISRIELFINATFVFIVNWLRNLLNDIMPIQGGTFMKKYLNILVALALVISLSACTKTNEPILKNALTSFNENEYYFRGYMHNELPTGTLTSESVFEIETITRNFPGVNEWNEEEISTLDQFFDEMIVEIVELSSSDEFSAIDPFELNEEDYIFMLKNDTYEVFFLSDNRVVTIDTEGNHEYLTYQNGGYAEIFENYAAKFRDAINKHIEI